MNEQERVSKIISLESEINPINYRRIFLETKLHFMDSWKDKKEVDLLKKELTDLYNQLRPLFEQLREVQCHYEIVLQGELTHENIQYWNQPEHKVFHLHTCCQIDTFSNGWENYINDPCVNNLIEEVHKIIFQQQYSNFRILNLRRIIK